VENKILHACLRRLHEFVVFSAEKNGPTIKGLHFEEH
jgi:hypothetical protein